MKNAIQQGSLLDMSVLENKEVKPSQPVSEKKMSRLEELIAKFCPNGVEYKTLGEICTYGKERIEASLINENNYIGVDNILPNKAGKVSSNYVPKKGNVIKFEKGDILIGNIRPYLRKIWLSDCQGGTNGDVLVIKISSNKVYCRYLYYVLSSENFFIFDIQNSKGAKMPRGDKDAILKYKIPVPPLPVQEEIVRILDTFSELTAELTAELTKRKQQYQYYRDSLVDFSENRAEKSKKLEELIADLCPRGVEYKELKSVCNFITGFSFKSSLFKKHGNAICKTTNIIDGYISFDKMDYFDLCDYKENLEKFIIKKNDIVIGMSGTIKVGISNSDTVCYLNQRVGKFIPDIRCLNNKFLYYFLCNIVEKQYANITGGSVKNLSNDEIKTISLPVPPLLIQKEIVAILDRFDALCNDLTSGLPAEIEARKKQYEYYRDKLLTFKEAV